MSHSPSAPARRLIHALALLLLALGAVTLPACSDGEGTLYTITSEPDASGGDPLLVFRTNASGWDDAAQRSFTTYVEVYGIHSEEFLPMGVRNLTVFIRMYTFDGPEFPLTDVEIRSDGHATGLLASSFTVETGQDQIEVPGTGAKKNANFLACASNGGSLMMISARKLVTFKAGPVEVELNFDQLQGIAKLLDRLKTPPSASAPAPK